MKASGRRSLSVVKADGERVPFDVDTIRRSLRRAGASPAAIDAVVEETIPRLEDGMTTKALYRIVYRFLRRQHRSTAGRYHLKRAIQDLGPTGFPFERFVAALLEAEGYTTEVGTFVSGRCIEHEIDVIATNQHVRHMVECKFHRRPGRTSDAKDALYTYARFLDVEASWKSRPDEQQFSYSPWLVTNTRVTEPARRYGRCTNMHVVSWDYPKAESIRDRIDRFGTHPITCISRLSRTEQTALLQRGIVLCRTLCEQPHELESIGVAPNRRKRVLAEAADICKEHSSPGVENAADA